MKEAKELFKGLGYEEVEPFGIFKKTYRRFWNIYENEDDIIEEIKQTGTLRYLYINFCDIFDKYIAITMEDVPAKYENGKILTKQVGEQINMPPIGIDFTLNELQAINKQIEELGWIGEE